MIVLNFLIPEILLITSILVLLMVGVFIKNSFEIIYRSSIFLTLLILLLILTSDIKDIKIFNDSFVIDDFSIYLKILILLSTFFIY
jgi:NADH:ubiquinone oxidoreductase subunit 2 (chain N)